MIFYIIRRLLAAIPTLLAVLTLVFLIVRVVPGDPAIAILGDRATPDGIAALHAKLGLDKPIWRQYVDFLAQSLSGDFGRSMVTGRPILSDVGAVLPHTMDLTLASLIVGSVIGVPVGIWAALHRNRADRLRRAPAVADRPVVPGVRLRHLHPAGVRAALAAVPGDRQRQPRRSDRSAGQAGAAGGDARPGHGRLHHARDAQRHAVGAGRGLHPHRARQGHSVAPRGLAPRVAQCRDAGGDRGRPLYRHPDRQLGADRDRVQPPGPRQDHRRRAEPARLHDAAGADGDLLLPDRGGEPDHRPHLRHHRSAGEAGDEAWRHDCACMLRQSRHHRHRRRAVPDRRCSARCSHPGSRRSIPNDQNIIDRLQPPGGDYLFGTDSFGRDVLSPHPVGCAHLAAGGGDLDRRGHR